MTRCGTRIGWLCIIVLMIVSCDERLEKAESQVFQAEVRKTFDAEYLRVEVKQKSGSGDRRRLISVQRDRYLNLTFLDDSTLLVTKIRARGDSWPAFLTNLHLDQLPTLRFPVGTPMISHDTLGLTTITIEGVRVKTLRKTSRDDVLFIVVDASSVRNEQPEVIILFGAETVEIESLTQDMLEFTCTWMGSHAKQSFSVDVSDLSFDLDDFSLKP